MPGEPLKINRNGDLRDKNQPLVLFIIPLVSRRYASDWEKTTKMLEETLASIRNQSVPSFHCIIVSDQMPDLTYQSGISFVESDFDLADSRRYGARCIDKQKKVYLALLEARQYNPGYVMIIDGDDWLHRDVIKFVQENSEDDCFILGKGYYLQDPKWELRRGYRMEKACASTSIFRFNAKIFPTQLLKDEMYAYMKFPLSSTPHVRSPQNAFSSWDYKSKDIPFCSVIYRVHDGAMSQLRGNDSTKLRKLFWSMKLVLKRLLVGRKIDRRISEEFSVKSRKG
jgi:glycosyltransferase involved in cell wall biosynthesis